MNAGIVILENGMPCIAYDEKLPFAVRHVEFCRDNFQITLIYDTPSKFKKEGKTFEFPLGQDFVRLLEEKKTVAVACIVNNKLSDLKEYSVFFIENY